MKKVMLLSYNMDMGGIEKSLLILIKNLVEKGVRVTLVLQKKEGVLLNELPVEVTIIEYAVADSGNVILRKLKNRLHLISFIYKHKNKYDLVLSYTPYVIPFALIASKLSKNNGIFVHNDYYYYFDGNISQYKEFFKPRSIHSYKRIIFVSNEGKLHFDQIYPELSKNTIVCNNFLDAKAIDEKLEEYDVHESRYFINISRHDEHQKQLTRLILAAEILKNNGYQFKVFMIGDGPNHAKYKQLVDELELQEYIKITGLMLNPIPYLKNSLAFVMTSNYEGFPVVYLEALYLKVPIITTIDVSDDFISLDDSNSIIIDKSTEATAKAMAWILDQHNEFEPSLNVERYNQKILSTILNMIE